MDLKKAKLSDNASIYAKREEKTEKQKWSELNGKDKWKYFCDYYLGKTVIILAVAAFVIYFLYTVFSPKPIQILNVAVSDYTYLGETFDKIEADLYGHLSVDPEEYKILVDSSYSLRSDYSSSERFSIYVYSEEVDILIAPEDVFQTYLTNGLLYSLSEVLPTDVFSEYSDDFLIGQIVDYDYDGTTVLETYDADVYGIYLDSLSILKDYSYEGARPVLGIVATSNNTEYAVDCIDYLFKTYGADE